MNKILILSSNPKDTSVLVLDREVPDICLSQNCDQFDVEGAESCDLPIFTEPLDVFPRIDHSSDWNLIVFCSICFDCLSL